VHFAGPVHALVKALCSPTCLDVWVATTHCVRHDVDDDATDAQGVAGWHEEWRAYCTTTAASLQAWLQADTDDMAIMQVSHVTDKPWCAMMCLPGFLMQ